MEEPDFNWKEFEKHAVSRLINGGELGGKDGVLAPLVKRLLEASLEGEITSHVEDSRPNRRNGKIQKAVKTQYGSISIDSPRDRDGSFDSALLPKRSSQLGVGLENKIISLYSTGMSYQDIRAHLEELYGLTVSEAAMVQITNKVLDDVLDWQQRELDSVYPFVWLDAIRYKSRESGKVVQNSVYTILALRMDGQKELLGLYIGETESSRYWMGVLQDLKQRGLQDILIASTDNLTGFEAAIQVVFPKTEVQLCIVHQIRTSLLFVPFKDSKAVVKDLRMIYTASKLQDAEMALDRFEQIWGAKYPKIVESWKRNWDQLMVFMKYSKPIRQIIYTTNPVEAVHRQLRRVTKTKGAFVNNQALIKLLYLAQKRVSAKWCQVPNNWGLCLQELLILFEDRLVKYPLYLNQ
ncbi:MAG: IS256 family transposase [Bacteroidetes bacterium]|nr:IS256 family transposase [Bacteroidota bacterium]